MSLVVAVVAALAILLIAVGIASGGQGSGITSRLERYAAGKEKDKDKDRQAGTGPQSLTDRLSQSAALARLNKVVEGRDFGANLARELAAADLRLKVSEYIGLWAGSTIGAPLVFIFLSVALPALRSPFALILAVVLGFLLPRMWLSRRKSGRLNAFNKQLPDTITLLSNSLRAGSSFLQSVELVSRESPAPMGLEMGRVVREVNLGLGMEEALANMVRRIKSDDLDLMVTAIGVQQQVGGNLAEILDTIAFTIRERVRIKGEIRTLTAQGRYSGYLVAFLPIAIAVTLNFINPEFMQPLFTELIGQILLVVGAIMMAIGFFAIRKITDIKV
jgi:tight adherence protein B